MPTPFAAGRRQAVLERADVVLVHLVRLEVAARAVLQLRLEPPALLDRIVQLAEGVGHLEAADVELEALDRVRIVRLLLRERRDFGRKVVDEGRLNQPVLAERLEDLGRDLARAVRRLRPRGRAAARAPAAALAVAQVGVGDRRGPAAPTRPRARRRAATARANGAASEI